LERFNNNYFITTGWEGFNDDEIDWEHFKFPKREVGYYLKDHDSNKYKNRKQQKTEQYTQSNRPAPKQENPNKPSINIEKTKVNLQKQIPTKNPYTTIPDIVSEYDGVYSEQSFIMPPDEEENDYSKELSKEYREKSPPSRWDFDERHQRIINLNLNKGIKLTALNKSKKIRDFIYYFEKEYGVEAAISFFIALRCASESCYGLDITQVLKNHDNGSDITWDGQADKVKQLHEQIKHQENQN